MLPPSDNSRRVLAAVRRRAGLSKVPPRAAVRRGHRWRGYLGTKGVWRVLRVDKNSVTSVKTGVRPEPEQCWLRRDWFDHEVDVGQIQLLGR